MSWIPDNSRLSATENLKSEHVRSNPVQTGNTRHDTDTTVLACLAVGVNWALGIIDWNAAPFAWRAHTGTL